MEQNILERIVQTEIDTIIIQKPLFCPETKLSHKREQSKQKRGSSADIEIMFIYNVYSRRIKYIVKCPNT